MDQMDYGAVLPPSLMVFFLLAWVKFHKAGNVISVFVGIFRRVLQQRIMHKVSI